MTTQRPEQQPEAFVERRLSRGERRRARIAEELRRNREGNHTVPTWVLAAILGLLLAGWITLIVVS